MRHAAENKAVKSALTTFAESPARSGSSERMTRLPIAEWFTSIQGEGKLTGTPSFFIRTSGCNLRCSWCDTPYASWNPEGESQSIEMIANAAERSSARYAVITGGEPMIFDAIGPLCAELSGKMHVTVETAGTVFRDVACHLMSISPKLSNSTPGAEHGVWHTRHERRRINLNALQSLIDHYPHRQLKFVITGRQDFDEIDDLLGRLRGWRDDDVMLMPEGVSEPSPELRQIVNEACVKRNWRYCQRLHITLFGNKRGT